ncbi:MAG TPA: hypothetical protein VLE91_01250 [Candidatus Saccharimonadales bacterium]|nr:hypothetical protein [Candidatus Saccharimonadales bacterium]
MKIVSKILFLTLATAGIVLVYYLSWFWRLFLIPIVVLLIFDVVSSFLKKK